MNFVVHAPEFSPSGGVRALHYLAKAIEARDHRAGMAWWQPIQANYAPLDLDNARAWSTADYNEAIHVFPQSEVGHLPGGSKDVRWILNTPYMRPNPPDLVLTWLPELYPGAQRLMLDLVERDIFYPKSKPGTGALFWQGKGVGVKCPEGAIPITSHWPERDKLGDLLRAADVLYSADSFSCLNLEAAVCGTPVVLVGPHPERAKTELFGSYGISSDEDHARSTVGDAWGHYQYIRREIAQDVDRFLEVVQSHKGWR